MRAALPLMTAAMTALLLPIPALANDLHGRWRTDDGKAVIEFAPCGAGVSCGRIARFLVPEPAGGARDGKNGNAALRDRRLVGLAIFTDLKADGKAWKGKGYSPEEGRNFNATITPGADALTVRGCVAVFCRTAKMTRMR